MDPLLKEKDIFCLTTTYVQVANMSSLKNSIKSKKGRKKSSQPTRGSSGLIDLSPVIEQHDEDAADIVRDKIMGRQHQRRVFDAHNQKFRSLDHNDTYIPQHASQTKLQWHHVEKIWLFHLHLVL